MTVLLQCTMCGENPMEPYETQGGTYYKCRNCDVPKGKMPQSRPEDPIR